MATWQTERHRQRHFGEHGAEMGYASIDEYDAGADDTLGCGRYFRYWDDNTGLDRIGCFDVHTGRFVVTNEDGAIVSFFLTTSAMFAACPTVSAMTVSIHERTTGDATAARRAPAATGEG